MSVFKDFQEAWCERFPECDVPNAWEDDVRGNLDKHRIKVASLKKELEKEEFYVTYLEGLLKDVNKSKNNKQSEKIDAHDQDTQANPDQYVTVITVSSYGEINKTSNNNATKDNVYQQVKSINNDNTPSFDSEIDVPLILESQSKPSLDSIVKRRRPPTPPKKPKINRVALERDRLERVNSFPIFRGKCRNEEDSENEKKEKDEQANNDKILNNQKQAEKCFGSSSDEAKEEKILINERIESKRIINNRGSVKSLGDKSGEVKKLKDKWLEEKKEPIKKSEEMKSMEDIIFKRSEEIKRSFRNDAFGFSPKKSLDDAISKKNEGSQKLDGSQRSFKDIVRGSIEDIAFKRSLDDLTKKSAENISKNNDELVKQDLSVAKNDLIRDYSFNLASSHNENKSPCIESSTEYDIDDKDYNDDEAIYDTVAPDEYDEENKELDYNSSISNLSNTKYGDSPFSNYVNIDYFLKREEVSSKNDSDDNETTMSHSIYSDTEIDQNKSGTLNSNNTTYDEVFEPSEIENSYCVVDDNALYKSNNSRKSIRCDEDKHDDKTDDKNIKDDDYDKADDLDEKTIVCSNENFDDQMYKRILNTIIESETIYVDCLYTLIQFKKVMKSTFSTTQPILSSNVLDAIFHKVSDLHSIHSTFLNGCLALQKAILSKENKSPLTSSNVNPNVDTLGDLMKMLASRLNSYSDYLKNYSLARETVQKCSNANHQFSKAIKEIKLKSMKGRTTTLEELFHKPVARVQENALILHDLLKYIPESSKEYSSIKIALNMTQSFLNGLNFAATEQNFPVQDKTQRRLVKESFIIEATESRRKLRHLFLFNDTIVCAKYKPSSRQKFTFDLKWYALLCDITVSDTDDNVIGVKEKEMSSEIMSLKSKVSSTRDAMFKEEKNKSSNKVLERYKKKLSELEGQLVLILPQLHFVLFHKNGKNYTFYLSSEFERNTWIEAIKFLQQSVCSSNEAVNFNELQVWIETCRKGLNPNLGSFLMRSSKDEDLLHGDLYLNIGSLRGFNRPADMFIVVECDNYGHFFQKATSKVSRGLLEPDFHQEFVIDLDGSQTLRIILYEELNGHKKPSHRGKANIELARSWLKDQPVNKEVSIAESKLSITLKFISLEASTTRFPAAKVYGAFGVPITQVAKKEKSDIPYLIVGCVREVERRGVKEVGIYRVSGLSSDIQKLKKAFESNPYEAEHLLKEIDIHSVTGLLKMYLRELPEALFTNSLYKSFFDAFNMMGHEKKVKKLTDLFMQLPQVNQNTINFLIDHLVNVNNYENQNKMTLHNLATVFGPTLVRPGSSSSGSNFSDQFAAGTIDVMAQAGILLFFLERKATEIGTNSCL